MKRFAVTMLAGAALFLWAGTGMAAYHHEGERDSDKFLEAYPEKAGTKLDHCATCHSGGQYERKPGKYTSLGSCQWCHHSYGYDGAGDIDQTMNDYGRAYKAAGRNAAALANIETDDSDGDGSANKDEIDADRFPGNPDDDPSKVPAPYRVYTRAQIEALTRHTEFLLMNTSRSGDFYAEYTGIPLKDLLDDAGVLDTATGITVIAPDGWSQYHPLDYDGTANEMYHVYDNIPGQSHQYPPAAYHYDHTADENANPDYGWCDYSAPSCAGRSDGDPIYVSEGLKAILAYRREGVYMDAGVLNAENKLDGEGPFRVVVPQVIPNPPDQSSRSDIQDVIWPYVNEWDHNAGACTRSVTIIRVEPLPAGTTDIDVLEAGWSYVDNAKVIIYGAIDNTDSNGNGILDSEEGSADPDPQKARVRQANGSAHIQMECNGGVFKKVKCLQDGDPAVPQRNRPASMSIPYGTASFNIDGLAVGASVNVTLTYPGNIPENARYYKIDPASGWHEIPFADNDGDNTIIITLTDGDPATDADGVANGTIVDPGAVAVPGTGSASGGGGGGGCFIATAAVRVGLAPAVLFAEKALELGFPAATALCLALLAAFSGIGFGLCRRLRRPK